MKKIFLLLLILCTYSLSAEECTVSGTVTDIWNNPLIGVEVLLEEYPEINTFTNGDGGYRLAVSGIGCQAVRLVFIYCGVRIGNVAAEGRNVVDLKEVQLTYYEYVTTISVMLRGNIVRTPFAAGIEFYDDRLWNKWFNARGESTYYGYVAYHTNFSENSEIHAQLYKKPLYRKGLMANMTFDRYTLPGLETDMDCYKLAIGKTNNRQVITGSFEYAHKRYIGQDDEASLIAGLDLFFRQYLLFVHAGISHNGSPQFNVGGTVWQSKQIPLSGEVSGGYWLDDWKCHAGIKHHFKHLDISIGYTRMFDDNNLYLKLMVPVYKTKTIEIEK